MDEPNLRHIKRRRGDPPVNTMKGPYWPKRREAPRCQTRRGGGKILPIQRHAPAEKETLSAGRHAVVSYSRAGWNKILEAVNSQKNHFLE